MLSMTENPQGFLKCQRLRGGSQKSPPSKATANSGLRSSLRRSRLDARSVPSVREHGKLATCLLEAAFSLRTHFGEVGQAACAPKLASASSAKAGKSAGGFFQQTQCDPTEVRTYRETL